MIQREITGSPVGQVQEAPLHLVLHLVAAEELPVAQPQPLSVEEKVMAFVAGLMHSGLFEPQVPFLNKWQVHALPKFNVLETKEQKGSAARNLTLLFIDVIVPARVNRKNLSKQREIDIHEEALKALLKLLLPSGASPARFLVMAQMADKKTAMCTGQMAILSHGATMQVQQLEAAELALHQKLRAHFADLKAHYLALSSSNMLTTETEREKLLAIGAELESICQALTATAVQSKEMATKLHSVDTALKQTLANCQSTLNERITR